MFQRSTFQCSHVQRSTFVTTQAAWRSAIEIAPGRLFAGRPHRRGFNRMPELRLPGVQRVQSPLEGFSPGVHTGAVSTACLSSVQRLKSPLEGFSPGVHTGAVSTACLSSVQRLKSPLEGFSPGVHLRGRCHGDRIGGRPVRSVLSGAVSTARLSSCQHFNVQRSHVPTFNVQRSHVPTFNVQRSHVPTFHLQRSTFNVPTFNLQRSHVPPSTFNVRNSSGCLAFSD